MFPAELAWLADSLRNQGLAVSDPPQPIMGPPWAQGLTNKFIRLRYEPRSIALSPNGRRVAVGTKAGCVHTLSFSDESGTWSEKTYDMAGIRRGADGEDHQFAIRSLCFLGSDWLLAGFGLGRFRLFDLRAEQRRSAWVVEGEAPGETDQFLDQVQMLVPLVQRFEQNTTRQLVALGITPAAQPHFIYVSGSKGEATREPPASHFPGWTHGALVGGVWCRDLLWLLDDAGTLHAFEKQSQVRPERATWETRASVKLVRPPGGARLGALSGGDDGLIVQAGDYITLIRPEAVLDAGRNRAATLREPLDWLRCPGTTHVAAIQPFGAGESLPSRENPIWMYIASSVSGLLWVPWFVPQTPGARAERGLAASRVSSRAPFRSLAATGPREVLFVAAGTLRASSGQRTALDPCYLVFATREEQLGLISFIEMRSASERLARELPRVLGAADDEANSGGIVLWRARRLLYAGFGLDVQYTLRPRTFDVSGGTSDVPPIGPDERYRWTDDGPAPAWLCRLEAEDVDELSRDLVRVLRHSRDARLSQDQAQEFFERFRRWVFLLLHRATQLDSTLYPALPRELALTLCSGIDRYPVTGLDHVRIFGAALRKWITFGDGFGAKSSELKRHADWDWEGHRSIDAAVYASRLLNDRVDVMARSRLPSPHPTNPGIWSLAVASDGSFSVQSHTDGRITACSREGATLRWSDPRRQADDPIVVDADELAIQRSDTETFRKTLWYGPLSRALSLVELGGGRFLMVFGVRGWPGIAPEGHGPSIACVAAAPGHIAGGRRMARDRESGQRGQGSRRGALFDCLHLGSGRGCRAAGWDVVGRPADVGQEPLRAAVRQRSARSRLAGDHRQRARDAGGRSADQIRARIGFVQPEPRACVGAPPRSQRSVGLRGSG